MRFIRDVGPVVKKAMLFDFSFPELKMNIKSVHLQKI